MAANDPCCHILLVTHPAWGCLRPLCAFAAKAMQERDDVIVTFLIICNFDKRIEAECRRYFPNLERLRIVNMGNGFTRSECTNLIITKFPEYYRRLSRCEPVPFNVSGSATCVSSIAPTIVMTDAEFLDVMHATRAETGRKVPVLMFAAGSAYLNLRIFGPEKYGGMGNRATKARENNQIIDEAALKQMLNMDHGEVVQLPGLAPFYDYEWYPYSFDGSDGVSETFYDFWRSRYELIEQCDGFLLTSGEAYEPEAIQAIREWLKESGDRPLYAVGPILPPGVGKLPPTSAQAPDPEFQEFTDKILAHYGQNSLLYMSFGTVYWPRGGYIEAVVEVLLKQRVPFIFAIASPEADLPAELIEKAEATGLAMIRKWCPQQAILNHPVTGWVLTHCGINTVFESLGHGKPMIAWPMTFDQPANAALISLSLDVAFELIQVRTGALGLRPVHRNGGIPPAGTIAGVVAELEDVLERMKGREGERKRRNVGMVGDRFRKAWEEGGPGKEDFKKLLRHAGVRE